MLVNIWFIVILFLNIQFSLQSLGVDVSTLTSQSTATCMKNNGITSFIPRGY